MFTTSNLILASSSPSRRELLSRAGYRFQVILPDVDEPSPDRFSDPRTCVYVLSWLKAGSVARRLQEGLVLGADSIGWYGDHGIGKPRDEADARRILSELSGSRHELWTGVCLWRRPDDLQVAWQEQSLVEMKQLSAAELDAYIATGVWQGKSGAYAIKEESDPYIRVVKGTISNVIGLPLESLMRVLKDLGLHSQSPS